MAQSPSSRRSSGSQPGAAGGGRGGLPRGPSGPISAGPHESRDPWTHSTHAREDDDDVLTPDELAVAAAAVRSVLSAAERGVVESSAVERAHLAGAAEVLEQLVAPTPVCDMSV